MTQTVRAIYDNGTLRLLEPLNLDQNQEVEVTITLDKPLTSRASAPRVSAYFGSISDEDAKEMREAIEEAFEQVDPDEWK